MKTTFNYLLTVAVAFVFITAAGNLSAQEIEGGIVKYQQTTKFKFDTRDDQRWKDFIATLPKEGKSVHVLYFTKRSALYEENLTEKEAPPPGMARAMHIQNMGKPPKPELKKVFYDFVESKKTEQLEFMTRNFLVESDIGTKAWKMSNKKKKVLEYTCMGADLKVGDQTITAWFTSEIPISTGPAEYFGLPGLILGVEVNGEMNLLATSINLTAPKEEILIKPGDGKKVTQEEFDKILEEKIEEYHKTREENPHGHRGGGMRRH